MIQQDFLLTAITSPKFFAGEADCLEGLLEAGLEKLHLRKPGMMREEARAGSRRQVKTWIDPMEGVEQLLERLAPRWHSRLVLHGSRDLAKRYKIPQIHGMVRDMGGEEIAVSTSVHSWEEAVKLPEGIAYAFISPLFDSISKPGYRANETLLQRPSELPRCRMIGLGGIGEDTIGSMIRQGWEGAAVLGSLWEGPIITNVEVVRRFRRLQEIVNEYRS
jgi:thiamine-phosphate pyrophosphorylase